jgi:Protein of unknown function (DUF3303)
VDYVAFLSFRPSASAADRDAALMRRVDWSYPSGIELKAEYWALSSSVQVVSIVSADNYADLLQLVVEWEDVFAIDVHPAISAEEGLKTGAEVLGQVRRLQPQG